MERFYWVVEEGLAGCSLPGGRTGHSLERDLSWLRDKRIGAVLSLTEEPLDGEALQRSQLEAAHIPVPDMHAPVPEQFTRALEFIDLQRAFGRSTAVHCLVGQGRTATILAAYLIRAGAEPHDAIARLRGLCPGAIASTEQEQALHAFAKRRDWIV